MPDPATTATSLTLADHLLDEIERRADDCPRAGRFSREDFEALRETGYCRAPVPAEYGGSGLMLREMAVLQRRVAYRSAPAALAFGPHLFRAGAAADRARAGDVRAERILRAVADGQVIGEISSADHVIAALGGRKPAGSACHDSLEAWAVVLTANVYLGVAQRAFDLAVEAVAGRAASGPGGNSRIGASRGQAGLAESVADLDAIEAHLDAAARDWTDRPVADAAWKRRLLSVEQHTSRAARSVVGRSLEAADRRSPRVQSVIERLYRDIVAGEGHNRARDSLLQILAQPDYTSRESFAR